MVFLYLISKGCENMEKTLEQLKQEYEKTTVLLEQEKRKMQRLKNRQAYLESGSRKQRTHRLITRGAAIESIAPQTKELSEAEFYSLMETKSHPSHNGQVALLYFQAYRSHFQKWQLYGSSVLPPPKSWSAPVMRSTARPQPASKWASNGLPSALMATSTRSPSA